MTFAENTGLRALIQDYLTNRLQRVNVNGTLSDWLTTERGVPQGTVLGPLLFLLYINDINDVVNNTCEIIQYADDTMIFTHGCNMQSIKQNLECNISGLSRFFQMHKLILNLEKTKFIIIAGRKNQNSDSVSLVIDGYEVKPVKNAKYLGVIVDNRLSFADEVSSILRKMAQGIKAIYRVRDFVPQKTRVLLLNALVISHFAYSSCLLTDISKSLLVSLEKQLNWGHVISNPSSVAAVKFN